MRIWAQGLGVGLLAAGMVWAQEAPGPEVRQCSICHGKREFKKVQPDGSVRPLFVDERELKASVHARWHCLDCHADIKTIPHPERLEKVNCQRCHFPGNPVGAPEEVNYEGYVESVHGRLQRAGNPKAPRCQDCHGAHGVRKASDPNSLVYKRQIPATCGKCHPQVLEVYQRSVHGTTLLVRGNNDAPSCSDCHGEHQILPRKEQASEVSATQIPETCGHCHGSLEFNQKYDIPVNPVKTFKHSFHGIANELGSMRVANCASCHTAHAVLPPSDPESSVHPANIPKTCGKEGCHPGANVNYARGRFHIDPSRRDAGVVYWVALFFKYLTVSTLAALILHILLDLRSKLQKRAQGHE
ncbi:MAG: hypothetical protein NZ869_09815 [Thermoanaerobaculum sp.]|nr:hypothetical protein [Thermoanaerobaculum sp.]MDW7967134.1 cytochrome c3 family protein [Thermoanaerobaculum sp.]